MFKNFIKDEKGVITLEAALVIPIMVTFILILVGIVQVGVAEMALQETVSETAETMAHYSYVSEKVSDYAHSEADAMLSEAVSKGGKYTNHNSIVGYFLEYGKSTISGPISDKIDGILDGATESIGNNLGKELYKERVGNGTFFNGDNVQITTTLNKPYVEVEGIVTLPLTLPFFSKDLKIKKKAVERQCVGKS